MKELVEYIGCPGSGKTYLAEKKLLTDRESISTLIYINSKGSVLKLGLKFFLFIIGFLISKGSLGAYRVLYDSAQSKRINVIYFNYMLVRGILFIDAKRARGSILDQGFSQLIWSILFYSQKCVTENEIKYVIDFFCKELSEFNITIYGVRSERDVLISRLANRKGFSPLDSDISRLEESIVLINKITCCLQEKSLTIPNLNYEEIFN